MSKTDKNESDDKFISCSRCHIKYHNTSESITKNFGYKRLGDRYKLCIKCRNPDNIKHCCVCFIRLNKNNRAYFQCNHDICKCCTYNIYRATTGSNIIKCPMCRREFSREDNMGILSDFKPVLFKVVFKDNIEMGLTHPLQIFSFTSRSNFNCGVIDNYFRIEETWIKKMKVLFNILKDYYSSDVFKEPLIIYMYKEEGICFTLKTNKPLNFSELVSFYDFDYYLQQDEEIMDIFFKNYFETYFGIYQTY